MAHGAALGRAHAALTPWECAGCCGLSGQAWEMAVHHTGGQRSERNAVHDGQPDFRSNMHACMDACVHAPVNAFRDDGRVTGPRELKGTPVLLGVRCCAGTPGRCSCGAAEWGLQGHHCSVLVGDHEESALVPDSRLVLGACTGLGADVQRREVLLGIQGIETPPGTGEFRRPYQRVDCPKPGL